MKNEKYWVAIKDEEFKRFDVERLVSYLLNDGIRLTRVVYDKASDIRKQPFKLPENMMDCNIYGRTKTNGKVNIKFINWCSPDVAQLEALDILVNVSTEYSSRIDEYLSNTFFRGRPFQKRELYGKVLRSFVNTYI
jgi:hypothetical protein